MRCLRKKKPNMRTADCDRKIEIDERRKKDAAKAIKSIKKRLRRT